MSAETSTDPQAGVSLGAGVVAADTPRVTLASDDPAVVSLGVLSEPTFVDVTLTLDTSAYTAGDVLAATQVVSNAVPVADGVTILQSIALTDINDQGAAFDLHFFSANQSLGAENGAPDIDDTEVLDYLGTVAIGTADWIDLGGAKVACIKNIGLTVKAASGTRDIYVGAVNGAGTPTYTASGLKLRLGFLPS